MTRGTFLFDVSPEGSLTNSAGNVQALGRLWLDRSIISGDDLGPGDPGDFDNGAWHISCHLAGATGVLRSRNGGLLWVEISHSLIRDEYYASVTLANSGTVETLRVDSEEGRTALQGAALLGYIEGNSTGRTSARNVSDSPVLFNLWRRQDFDQPITSLEDGGKVWEHWCTLRDLRPQAAIGNSVLTAYISIASVLGDRFGSTVARGRRDYAHPKQLVALVRAGFTTEAAALWDVSPVEIPPQAEALLLQADPSHCFAAANLLDWATPPKYFMYKRRISHWSSAGQVKSDFSQSSVPPASR